jgi:hypothetical protein
MFPCFVNATGYQSLQGRLIRNYQIIAGSFAGFINVSKLHRCLKIFENDKSIPPDYPPDDRSNAGFKHPSSGM